MTRSVQLSQRATQDLSRLTDFLSANSPRAAWRAAEATHLALLSLRELAERGASRGRRNVREFVIPFGASAYVTRYTIAHDVVTVTRVWHGRERRR